MSTTLTKQIISYDEFVAIESKLSIMVGEIVHAERIPKSNGLKLTVSFGDPMGNHKTAFTNLGKFFEPTELAGRKFPFIMNLAPSIIKGVTSEVMIMVSEREDGSIDLTNSTNGSKLM